MTRRLQQAALVASTTLLATACFVPKDVGEQMQRDIAQLQQRARAAEKGIDEQRAALQEKTDEASERIREVDQALQDLNRAARMTDADFGIQLERLIRETQELRGMVELTEYRLSQLEAKLEGPGSLNERVEKLEGKPVASSEPTVIATEVPDRPKEMLNYADGLVKQGKVAEARGVYRQVIKKAPKAVGITDRAYYELGSLYYDEKKYRSALTELVKVAEDFGRGSYADDAYFKIGLCSMDLGNLEDAKIFFNEIIKSYRKSPLVPQAKKQLREVEKRLKREKR